MGTDKDRRRALGLPPDAERVLVFTETSHWDLNWLLTSEGYFRLRVRRNLRQALDALAADPRRVYSVECVFFLRMFYERVPQRRAQIRQFVNEGRLRMMGSGVTTPDTIIPPAELQIRDYLLGQEWLRRHGMDAEPDVAYFPDTFGFSPGLPDVLGAVGVTGAGLCRVDGMYFLGNETESARHFPRPGSTAHLLSNEERITVGTLYKQVSPFEARKVGAALIAKNISHHLETRFSAHPKSWRPLVYCWRGGQRSDDAICSLLPSDPRPR